jgi:hypothetical protein
VTSARLASLASWAQADSGRVACQSSPPGQPKPTPTFDSLLDVVINGPVAGYAGGDCSAGCGSCSGGGDGGLLSAGRTRRGPRARFQPNWMLACTWSDASWGGASDTGILGSESETGHPAAARCFQSSSSFLRSIGTAGSSVG